MKLKTIDDMELNNKRVIVRCDLNLPLDEDGKVRDTTRIKRLRPTIEKLTSAGAKIILLSHFGRPKGERDEKFSLGQVIDSVAEVLEANEIIMVPECVGKVAEVVSNDLKPGGIALLENVRFHSGEESNSDEFANALSLIGDVYINDAFSVCHRDHASVTKLPYKLPSAAGIALNLEIEMLNKTLLSRERPSMALVGGMKISTKISLLENLISKVDFLVIGGVMANTFLHYTGKNIGNSSYEPGMKDAVNKIIKESELSKCKIILPVDVVVAEKLERDIPVSHVSIEQIPEDKMIFDIGAKTIDEICNTIASCKTIMWNGPLGVFEVPPFDVSTSVIGRTIAILTRGKTIISVAGGGDTVAALNYAGISGGFSYISVAGGAFLDWIEKNMLPGIKPLLK